MAKATKDILGSLNENQTKLDQLATMFPGQFEDLSMELKNIVSAITDSQNELHEVTTGVKDLQLKAKCNLRDPTKSKR
jgi:hypothetical protein